MRFPLGLGDVAHQVVRLVRCVHYGTADSLEKDKLAGEKERLRANMGSALIGLLRSTSDCDLL